ncbi:MAG TPA: methyltransferase, partial [Solirubrobacteraceae bacterium]|nr:methyltransferase [Solirubrobacteraceae bacterium]
AVELGLFTELAKCPLDGETLRQRLDLHPRSVRDFFDALVALGVLEREGDAYRNTPETDLFLDHAKPTYVGGILEMANARLYPFWGSLTEGLRTGEPQSEIEGEGDLFEALYADPERLQGFLSAMSSISLGPARVLAERFPWDRHERVVDVGCAEGQVPVQLALAHAHLGGGGFDLPAVQPYFERFVARAGLDDRLRFHGGDFFADELPPADVLIMGHILHDWDLDGKRTLLEKAHRALPDGGALIVYEAIIDDDRRENAFGLLMSLNMLLETRGGFDFTGAECQDWMREAGFRETYVEPLVGPDSMVVATK